MCIYLYLKRFTHDCPDTLPGFERDAIENANAFTQESKRMQDIHTILHIAIHCIYILNINLLLQSITNDFIFY